MPVRGRCPLLLLPAGFWRGADADGPPNIARDGVPPIPHVASRLWTLRQFRRAQFVAWHQPSGTCHHHDLWEDRSCTRSRYRVGRADS